MSLFSCRSKERKFDAPTTRQLYPKWTFARIEATGKYYLLLDTTKMEFISERAFLSWGKPYVLASEESLAGYSKWKKISFAPGTIIISQADHTAHFITGSDPLAAERRLITTPDFWDVLGFDLANAFVVSLVEVDFHKKGEDFIGECI
jgi:hypothetical protein